MKRTNGGTESSFATVGYSVLSTQYLVLSTKQQPRRTSRPREAVTNAGKRSLSTSPSPNRQTFHLSLACSLLGGLILWAAFPPLNLWPIAWLAPLPWLYLILRPEPMTRWAYFGIWVGGFVHWLAMLYGISQAHILLVGGWILLAAYLGIYLPLFVGLCRVAALRLRISLLLVAPVVWVGLELARGYVVTGFSAGLLSHSQTDWPALLQIADIFGAYGVSFLMMFVAASVARGFFGPKREWWPLLPAAVAILLTLGYGSIRLKEFPPGTSRPALLVALIQGSRDVHIDMDYKQSMERMQHYSELTRDARQSYRRIDLLIWPESMFALPQVVLAPGAKIPEEDKESVEYFRREFPKAVHQAAQMLNEMGSPGADTPTPFYFCTSTLDYSPDRRRVYNSALLANETGEIVSRYDKTHAVMFGEYVPFAGWFPVIEDVFPIEGMTEGDQPTVANVKGLNFCPNICFESTVPHLIRSQVLKLEKQGTPVDVLVNLTNDGWFYGTSILDLHLKCGVFRAIENRKPFIIAANTGISANIDGTGRIINRGPRRQPQVLVVTVQPDNRKPLYHTLGDLPAIACAAACVLLLAAGFFLRRTDQNSGIVPSAVHESERNEPSQ
ncbi:MAG: apolipoprotein N-acyltransferase [Planctomycetales bacterium]|nr:apolipoprotein N-acyltransferase [Planctomycetales bacterium]